MLIAALQAGNSNRAEVTLRLDTPADVTYVRREGIMPHTLDEFVA